MATIAETSTGFPGYNAILPFDKGMLSEMLLPHGYNTFLVGKWHLSPPEHETPAGPYDRWPLGRGFERFYGFLGGDTNQWFPELVYDNHAIEQPYQPEEGYHLSADLADKAIEFIQDAHVNAPDKPFYLHYCTGAAHAPHHVPIEWSDKYKGRSTAAGTSTEGSSTSASSIWASSPLEPSCPPTTPMCLSGTPCRRVNARCSHG